MNNNKKNIPCFEESVKKYLDELPMYDKLAENLKLAIEMFLAESGIGFLTVSARVKSEESFYEKIIRKSYADSTMVEDICGLRIICYYQSDLKKIEDIIRKEFVVTESQDKEEFLNQDQFGYRSTHFIVQIKKSWLATPNYRGLDHLKAEIQVRTIFMHAWAEIEHKLAYKKSYHIPAKFKRKLYRLCAKLEESDEQFEELRNNIEEYRKGIFSKEDFEADRFDRNTTIDLDSFQAVLDYFFSGRKKNICNVRGFFDELKEYQVDIHEFIDSLKTYHECIIDIEEEIIAINETKNSDNRHSQVGLARLILFLTNQKYYEDWMFTPKIEEIISRWKTKLNLDV
ncbi:(p)ppGpp synthetase [bacterium]|nr:(p)ppGpp synthetase [bacterium]